MIGNHPQAFGELRIQGDFDAKPHGKSEAAANATEVVISWPQHDTADRLQRAEVDLHPLRTVGLARELAVVTVGRIAGRFVGSVTNRRDGSLGGSQPRAAASCQFLLDLLVFRLQPLSGGSQPLPLAGDLRIAVERPIRSINGGENRLTTVVVMLRDRIELVIVAPCALDRHAAERVERVAQHFVAVEVAGDATIDFRFRDFDVANEVPRPGGDETQSDDRVGLSGIHDISGQLLADEAGVGFVVIESADHIVAVGPRVGSQLVFVVAAGVGVSDDVEPVPGPAFTVGRRGQQAVDEPFVGIRGRIFVERVNLFG